MGVNELWMEFVLCDSATVYLGFLLSEAYIQSQNAIAWLNGYGWEKVTGYEFVWSGDSPWGVISETSRVFYKKTGRHFRLFGQGNSTDPTSGGYAGNTYAIFVDTTLFLSNTCPPFVLELPDSSDLLQPLSISNLTQSEFTNGSAVISYSTNYPTTGVIQYGSNRTYNSHQWDTIQAFDHSFTLTFLGKNTTYFYKITAYSDSEEVAVSDSLITPGPLLAIPALLDFGSVGVDSTKTLLVGINNQGTQKIDIGSVAIFGHSEFHYLGPSSFSINPGDTVFQMVELTPPTPFIDYYGYLAVYFDGPRSKFRIPLKGKGVYIAPLSANKDQRNLPKGFVFDEATPNPFKFSTSLNFSVPLTENNDNQVAISVFSLSGQKIRVLKNDLLSAGYYQVNWNGQDQAGNDMPSGVYLIKVKAGKQVYNRKVVLQR